MTWTLNYKGPPAEAYDTLQAEAAQIADKVGRLDALQALGYVYDYSLDLAPGDTLHVSMTGHQTPEGTHLSINLTIQTGEKDGEPSRHGPVESLQSYGV